MHSSGNVRTAGGDVLPIEGVGDILLRSPSGSGAFDIQLLNIAFVPQLNHNLLSLFTAVYSPPTIHTSVRKMVWNYSLSQVERYKLESSVGRMCCVGTV